MPLSQSLFQYFLIKRSKLSPNIIKIKNFLHIVVSLFPKEMSLFNRLKYLYNRKKNIFILLLLITNKIKVM